VPWKRTCAAPPQTRVEDAGAAIYIPGGLSHPRPRPHALFVSRIGSVSFASRRRVGEDGVVVANRSRHRRRLRSKISTRRAGVAISSGEEADHAHLGKLAPIQTHAYSSCGGARLGLEISPSSFFLSGNPLLRVFFNSAVQT
jgi:hypothetical protein